MLVGWTLLVAAGCDTKTDPAADAAGVLDAETPLDTTDPDVPVAASDTGVGTDATPATDTFALDLQQQDVVDCPGGTGCTCATAGDCNSGFCVETAAGLRCAPLCTSDCAPGFVCRSAVGEPINYCAPLGVRDCAPCTSNAGCNGAGAVPAACVSAGDAGSFCATVCQIASDCPAGTTCGVVAGLSGKVCLPDGGLSACTCSEWAKAAGATTICSIQQGSLACPGSRGCSAAGLSACSATPDEVCVDVGCAKAPDGATCVDDDACTADTTCKAGVCQGGNSVCECKVTADCAGKEDGNLCNGNLYCDVASNTCKVNPATVVTCAKAASPCDAAACVPETGKCQTTALPDNSACDDGKACTSGDYCTGGKCVSGTVTCVCSSDLDCTALEDGNACNGTLFCNKVKGQCQLNPATAVYCPSGNDTECSVNTCSKTTGQCEMVQLAEGTACNDGNVCTGGETCQNGQCAPSAQICSCTSDADCAAKEDGNLCNGTLFCDVAAGSCKVNPATVIACLDNGDACAPLQCVPETGKCAAGALPTGSPCDDGNACTQSEACNNGACVPGANLCACVTDADCGVFEDGNACNGTLYCDKASNSCAVNAASVVTCPGGADTPCNRNTCNPQTGTCGMALVADGGSCEDGNPCTANEVCTAGACGDGLSVCQCATDSDCTGEDDGNLCNGVWYCDKSGPQTVCKFNAATAVTCTDTDVTDCEVAVCLPSTGTCTAAVAADSTACDDDNPCTAGDTCGGGQCAGALATICNDNDPCTSDGCDPISGCSYGPVVETCDGLDNNCDGETDEANATGCSVWYVDADSDGFASTEPSACVCAKPTPVAGQVPGTDCDDSDKTIFPLATEACNGVDDNCDKVVDADGSAGCVPWYADADSDTYGDPATEVVCRCEGVQPPDGAVQNNLDCDPTSGSISPVGVEICNGQDDDCDTKPDDGFDLCSDPDNCGACGATCFLPKAIQGCSCGSGVAACQIAGCETGWYNLNGVTGDGCEYACTPSGLEACDSMDNDCDGQTDEGNDQIGCVQYFADEDGDGWGGDLVGCTCTPPLGYVLVGGDCMDDLSTVSPDDTPVCDNGHDNNCNGTDDVSEACVCSDPSRMGPACTDCASGYKETAPGQCGAAVPLWGAISGSSWGECIHPQDNPDVAYDSRTGLSWRSPDSMGVGIPLATGCEQSFGGYADWRTPTVAELMTILMTSPSGQPVASCVDELFTTMFGNVFFSASYWFTIGSELNFAPKSDDNGAVTFGQVFAADVSTNAYLTCVRGGNFKPVPAQRFVVDEAKGTVTDLLTNLTWERVAHNNVLVADVELFCDAVTTGGYKWRLPTALEATTLLDCDDVAGGFAGGSLQNWGDGDPMLTAGQLWTNTFSVSSQRVIAGHDLLDLGAMDDITGGYQVVCVRVP